MAFNDIIKKVIGFFSKAKRREFDFAETVEFNLGIRDKLTIDGQFYFLETVIMRAGRDIDLDNKVMKRAIAELSKRASTNFLTLLSSTNVTLAEDIQSYMRTKMGVVYSQKHMTAKFRKHILNYKRCYANDFIDDIDGCESYMDLFGKVVIRDHIQLTRARKAIADYVYPL